MKRNLLFAVLALAGVVQAQDLSQKVTIDIPAGRASAVMAALTKATGVQMQAAPNLAHEVFVVSVKDVTVSELMKRLAQAEGGAWENSSGTYILVRERSVTSQQERQEIQARAQSIARATSLLAASLAKQGAWNDTTARQLADESRKVMETAMERVTSGGSPRLQNIESMAGKTPAGRAIARIVADMDPAKLAQIALGQRVVYSTHPTRMQVPLSNKAIGAITAFINEQKQYVDAYRANEPAQQGNQRVFMMNGFGTPTLGNGDPRLGLGVGLVVINRRSANTLDFQLIAADTKYDTIASGNYTLQIGEQQGGSPKKVDEEPLKLSDDAMELAKALAFNPNRPGAGAGPMIVRGISLSSSGGGGDFTFEAMNVGNSEKIKLSDALRQKVLQPEKFDPLSFVSGEAVTALAKQRGKNLVALLPDSSFGSMIQLFGSSDVTPSRLLDGLAQTHGMQSAADAEWMVVSPVSPVAARAGRVNRAALGTMLRVMDKQGYLRLDDLAAFANGQAKAPGFNDLEMQYARLIDAGSANRDLMPLASGNYPVYRWYGSLSAQQRGAVLAGQQIPLMNFSEQQLALISDVVFNSPGGPSVQLPENPSETRGRTAEAMVLQMPAGAMGGVAFGPSAGVKTERTIVLPNGITRDGYLQAAVSSQPAVLAMNSQTGAAQMFDAASLGFTRSAQTEPQLASMGSSVTYDKYRMAQQTTIGLRFNFSQTVSLSRSLRDAYLDSASAAVAYEGLPADFRKRVEDAAAKMAQGMQNVPGIKRQQVPPPLP